MDVSDYRLQYEAELAQASQRPDFRQLLSRSASLAVAAAPADDVDDADAAMTVLRTADADADLRAAALETVGGAVPDRPELFDGLLALVRDTALPVDARLDALGLLQSLAFSFAGFPARRPDYLEALRSTVDDRHAKLRRRVIGILAREKDEYVQRRLLDGLEGREKALVPAAKAIQFLGYDVHAEYFPLLRRIIADPPNASARKEAIRVVAADPAAADLLLAILSAADEPPDMRRAAAAALYAVAPEQHERRARQIVMDSSEDDDLRALSLTTLTQLPGRAGDTELAGHVERLQATAPSRQLKRASAAYLSRQRD